jgi:hypothetical protein
VWVKVLVVPSILSLDISPSGTQNPSVGQSTTFTATVKDSKGNAVSGATVTIADGVKALSTSITTGSSGTATYAVTPTSAGTFSVTFGPAQKSGYTPSSGTIGRSLTAKAGNGVTIISHGFQLSGSINLQTGVMDPDSWTGSLSEKRH